MFNLIKKSPVNHNIKICEFLFFIFFSVLISISFPLFFRPLLNNAEASKSAVNKLNSHNTIFIEDIVFFSSSGESVQAVSQYGSDFEKISNENVETGLFIKGVNFKDVNIDKQGNFRLITIKNSSVRGSRFILPVFIKPVKSIKVSEEKGSARIEIELSHDCTFISGSHNHEKGILIRISAIKEQVLSTQTNFTHPVKPATDKLHNVTAKSHDMVVKTPNPTDKFLIPTDKPLKTFNVKENTGLLKQKRSNVLNKPGSSVLRPRLKDIDIVTDKSTGVEVRFKFTKIPRYRKLDLKDKVVLIFPDIDSDFKGSRIPVDKDGLKVINLSQGKDALRVVMMLDEKYEVDIFKEKRRLRAFIVEKDKELELLSEKFDSIKKRNEEKKKTLRINKFKSTPVIPSLESINLETKGIEKSVLLMCSKAPEFDAEIKEDRLVLVLKEIQNSLKASALIFNRQSVNSIQTVKKEDALEVKVNFSCPVDIAIKKDNKNIRIVYKEREVKVLIKNEPAVKPDIKPAVKPVAEPDIKPAVKPVAEPDIKPAVKPAAKPDIKPAVKLHNKEDVQERRALIKRLTKLIKKRQNKESVSLKAKNIKKENIKKENIKNIKNENIENIENKSIKKESIKKEVIKEIKNIISQNSEAAQPIMPRDLILAHTQKKLFIGVPLEQDFTWTKTITDRQIIIKIKGAKWNLPWTLKKFDDPLKFIKIIKGEQGFMMLMALNPEKYDTAEIKKIEQGLNIDITKKAVESKIPENGARENRAYENRASEKRIEEKQESVIQMSKALNDTGMDKSLESDKRVEIISEMIKRDKSKPDMAPLRPIEKRDLNPASIKNKQPEMSKLGVFDILGGKRVIMTLDQAVKPKVIKTKSQIILDFENVYFSDNEIVRMIFEDPLKLVRANISSKGLKIIIVLSRPCESKINYDKSRIIVDIIEISEKREKAIEQLTNLGRKRVNKKKMMNLKKRMDTLKQEKTGNIESVPVPLQNAGIDELKAELMRTSGDSDKKGFNAVLDRVNETQVPKTEISPLTDSSIPLASALTKEDIEAHPFGTDEKLFEYADAQTIERALRDSKIKGSAYELYIQGMALAERGDWIGAFESYSRSLELVPYDVNVIRAINISKPKKEGQEMFLKGNDFAGLDQWDKASWAYNEALKKDPANPKFSFASEKARSMSQIMNIYDEAVSFLKEGYYSKAVELLKKVTQARPGWAKGFIYLGRAYDGQKWHKAAVMTFQRALEIEPANGEVLGLMDLSRKKLRVQELYAAGKALEKNGKYLDAAEKYRSALALEEEYKKIAETAGSDYLGEANKLFNLGRLEETVNLSDKAIKVNPDDVDAHYLKGRALMGLGKIAEAVLEFKKVVELDPKKDVGLDELMMQ